MWSGIFPAVTTKFTVDDALDHKEMERCFGLQIDAGVDGFVVGGSLGEGPMLSADEKLDVFKTARAVAGKRPVLMTVFEAGTREGAAAAKAAAKAGADGLMVVPSPIYFTNPQETVTTLKAMAAAGGLPVMIYSNRMAYRVDVTGECLEELAKDDLFVAIKESSDDIRRTIDIVNQFGDRFDLFTGVDNLAFEALTTGAIGWVAGVVTSLPRETVVLYQLIKQKRYDEALPLYRWMRPLLDLDVSTYLVQNLKLIEVHAIQSNDRVRLPRLALSGERRASIEKIIKTALDNRPILPKI